VIGVTEATDYRWRAECGDLTLDQVKRRKPLEQENGRLRKAVAGGSRLGKPLSAARRRAAVQHVTAAPGVSERSACRVLGQHRSTQRQVPVSPDDEAALTAAIIGPARRYGRYGYRRITALLRAEGWCCNHKRVERIWRREGLKVPARQPSRGRLWLHGGSCVRLRPERPHHVWAYDFVEDRTRDGRKLRMLNVVGEFTRECLAIRVARKLSSLDVIDMLPDLFIARGTPAHVRSDNGPELVAKAVQGWIHGVGAKTAFIEPGSPWGERPRGEFQRQAARRAAERRGVQHRWPKPGCGSSSGGCTTTPPALIPRLATDHPLRR